MKWTEKMARAAELLGLDSENPKHRVLLEKCVAGALKPGRGRPPGSVVLDEDTLIHFALSVDKLKDMLVKSGVDVTYDELLEGVGMSGVKLPSPGTRRNWLTRGRRLAKNSTKHKLHD